MMRGTFLCVLFVSGVCAGGEAWRLSIVVDNADAGFETIGGKWNASTRDAEFYKSDYLWSNRRNGTGRAKWSARLPFDGEYEVHARWVCKAQNPASDRAANAVFTVFSGKRRRGRVTVDMSRNPGRWNRLGKFKLAAGEGSVELSNDAGNSVVADAVRFDYLGKTRGKVILEEDFERGLERWTVEDKGAHHKVEVRNGRLIVAQGKPMPGIFVWYNQDLPPSFRLEYDFTPVSLGRNRRGFYLLFFCARGEEGGDIFESAHWAKSALEDFRKYTAGRINCYHVGYLRGTSGQCNMRKNSGKKKVHGNSVPQFREGATYHVTLTKEGNRIRFEVKGPGIAKDRETFIDWTDPAGAQPVWGSGKLGFRQIGYEEGVVGAYDNVRVVDLTQR